MSTKYESIKYKYGRTAEWFVFSRQYFREFNLINSIPSNIFINLQNHKMLSYVCKKYFTYLNNPSGVRGYLWWERINYISFWRTIWNASVTLRIFTLFQFLISWYYIIYCTWTDSYWTCVRLEKKSKYKLAEIFSFYKDMDWAWTYSIYIAFALIIWIQIEMTFLRAVHWSHTLYMF